MTATATTETVKRKFLAEAGINLYSGGATVLRPSDLYRYGKGHHQFRDALQLCNIYLIARRPRISVDPYSLRASDGLLYGDFRVHENLSSFERYPFAQKTPLLTNDGDPRRFLEAKALNEFGFDIRVIDDRLGPGNIPAHVLIASANHRLGDRANLEVLYVGQGYGQDGKRLAVDRLLAHTTLQRILAESAEENPCDELFILLFRYEHAKNILSTAGDFSVQPSASDEEEWEHLTHAGGARLDRKSRVALAEAGLINYFKPAYNIVHRESFSAARNKKLKTLRKLFALDLSALIVKINTSNVRSKLYSAHAPAATLEKVFAPEHVARLQSPQTMREAGLSTAEVDQFVAEMTHAHIARFPLYSARERETFLHALPWNSVGAATEPLKI